MLPGKSFMNSRTSSTLPPVYPCSTFLAHCCFPPIALPNHPHPACFLGKHQHQNKSNDESVRMNITLPFWEGTGVESRFVGDFCSPTGTLQITASHATQLGRSQRYLLKNLSLKIMLGQI